MLALLVDYNFSDYQHYRRIYSEHLGADDEEDNLQLGFLDTVALSLSSDTRQSVFIQLLAYTAERKLALGQRIAAGLLGAVAASELDNIEPAADALEQLIVELDNRDGDGRSGALLKAIACHQLAVRLLELGELDRVRKYTEQCRSALLSTQSGEWESFTVSEGVSWDPSVSQTRVSEVISDNSDALSAVIADRDNKLWVDIVRRKPPINELRSARATVGGLSALVDETFQTLYAPSKSSTTLFRSGDPVIRPLFSALLNAELTGSIGRMQNLRELTGKALAVRNDTEAREDVASMREAIRLLRHADKDAALRRLAYSLRNYGPLNILKNSVEELLTGDRVQSTVTRSDVTLIEAGSDVLRPDMRAIAIEIVEAFSFKKKNSRFNTSVLAGWKRLETYLKATAALLPESGRDSHVVSSVLRMIDQYKIGGDQLLFSALTAVASAVDWNEVPEEAATRWREWFYSVESSKDLQMRDVFRMARSLGVESSVRFDPASLDFVAHVISEGIAAQAEDSPAVDKAVETCLDYLHRETVDAESGTHTLWSYSPAGLASGLIRMFRRTELWPALIAVLFHRSIPAREKNPALEILSDASVFVPPNIVDSLARSWPFHSMARDAGGREFLAGNDALTLASWRKLAITAGAVSAADAQICIIQDAASTDEAVRGKAAECASALYMSSASSDDWPIVLILQLSHDKSGLVRGISGRELARISAIDSQLTGIVKDRVSEIFREPGIALTLNVLEGFRMQDDWRVLPVDKTRAWWLPMVVEFAGNHPSFIVRRNAAKLLNGSHADHR
ncbi:hypothetical protein [Actinomadura coerulea]|uniref:hypothetical protein n=1 Tax=Actinomadura coerulea TaxID=46159 RepID=UPI00343FE6DA